VLTQRWIVLLVMAASAGGSWWLFKNAKSELAPLEDRGVILTTVNGARRATLDYTARYAACHRDHRPPYPEFDRVFVVAVVAPGRCRRAVLHAHRRLVERSAARRSLPGCCSRSSWGCRA
jgi:multidrug efflux pump subunit AcrB